jgi:hypothetical protein
MATQFLNVQQLINEALARLGVLSVGQPTDPEDFSYVQSLVDPTLRKLNQLDIVPVADQSNIPGAWFTDLADILAGEACTKFGATPQDQISLITKGLGGPPSQVPQGAGAAALSLKQQLRGRPTYEPVKVAYF